MFLSSYVKLREKLMLKNIINAIHLGAKAFEDISGEVVQTIAFILRNRDLHDYKTIYVRLVDNNSQEKENIFLSGGNRFITQNQISLKYQVCPLRIGLVSTL